MRQTWVHAIYNTPHLFTCLNWLINIFWAEILPCSCGKLKWEPAKPFGGSLALAPIEQYGTNYIGFNSGKLTSFRIIFTRTRAPCTASRLSRSIYCRRRSKWLYWLYLISFQLHKTSYLIIRVRCEVVCMWVCAFMPAYRSPNNIVGHEEGAPQTRQRNTKSQFNAFAWSQYALWWASYAIWIAQ